MDLLLATLFAVSCLFGVKNPRWMVAMIMLLYPIEQLLQAGAPFLRSGAAGGQVVNYVVGVASIGSALVVSRSSERPFMGLLNTATVTVTLLLLWATISLLWSLDRVGGLDMTLANWPYYFLRILIASFLITSVGDLRGLWLSVLTLGSTLCVLILVNPGFTSQWGRLGIVEGGKMSSNPLALGDLGALVFLSAVLFRAHGLGRWFDVVRFMAAILGIVVALQSGARGQVFLSFAIAFAGFPLALRLRNVQGFAVTVVGLLAIAAILPFFMSQLLEGVAAKRFSYDELLEGDSSATERWQNVRALFDAWSMRPQAFFVGIGYFSFGVIGGGAVYSHVIVADLVFELGIPGVVALVVLSWSTFVACKTLFMDHAGDPVERNSVAILIAVTSLFYLLANKQGDLWGSTGLFMLMAIVGRLKSRAELSWEGPRDQFGSPPLIMSSGVDRGCDPGDAQ
jgi:hypothetical protein